MATLRDVASAAGVSPATASRALSAPDTVSMAKRHQVIEAAERLNYKPNRSAQALASGQSRHIGLVLPDLANPSFAAIAKGVQAQARGTRYSVLVADTDEDPRAERAIVRDLQTSVDGLVLCSPRMPEEEIRECAAAGPLVLVNREVDGLPSVTFDSAAGVTQALQHLRALGHHRVAYVGGPEASWSDAHRRRALGTVEGVDVVDVGAHRPIHTGGVAAADLALGTGATAILCYNDLIALGVLSRLRTRGVDVPNDISVVGFDDIGAATYVAPTLTTVAIPLTRAGQEATSLLSQVRDTSADGTPVRLPVELVVRDSSGPAPA
ncbi:LacI family DNA-binding transcriptional regulator [Demequina globuliformis]|uniref:LacI family DNA-binding transcriptional regulator n=1 Tax=Demequina globuliformis TaxID=676202 RepID=UPI000781D9BF|nr:LacI family DNA-binding transcriptional regulator [Demequina globuliformis]